MGHLKNSGEQALSKKAMKKDFLLVCKNCTAIASKESTFWCYSGLIDGDFNMCSYTIERAKDRLSKLKKVGMK